MKTVAPEALLKAMAEGIEGLCYAADTQYRILFLNPRARQRVGRDARGEICYEALHRRESPCLFCVQDQVRQGKTVRFDMIHPADRRWYRSANIPVRHADGTISLLAMVTDIDDRKRAEVVLRSAEAQMRQHDLLAAPDAERRQTFGNIVGQSTAMQKVYEQILSAAASDATAIIYGEAGTGKELVAHAIHEMSERRRRRFVPVHCGAIPENLVESEFFGHVKGAFSGATSDKAGYVLFADGGTLFLDEVGEIPLHMQIKLLRLIEGLGFTPVGSSQVQQSNIRIIAATNRDLRERVSRGLLRGDFYYRIHILPIHLPPLRERKEDLPLLITHFLKIYGGPRKPPPLTGPMLATLKGHDWPGNVRELQNVIIRYCALHTLELGTGKLPEMTSPMLTESYDANTANDLSTLVAAFEKKIIAERLEQMHWHRSKVAAQLGVDRKTLFSKMKRYGLE